MDTSHTGSGHLMRKIVVGITGASGVVLGISLLRQLRSCEKVETHLILSRWARATIRLETELSVSDVTDLADFVYGYDEQVVRSWTWHARERKWLIHLARTDTICRSISLIDKGPSGLAKVGVSKAASALQTYAAP